MLTIISIRVYDGKGRPMGEFQTSIEAVQLWLANPEHDQGDRLVTARDLVDPDRQNKNYDWDLWVKASEIEEDLKQAF
tara:strand:+ start:1920 stop:2153 length:234 start_codon:yes stop_codon:yes gene_type:complete